MIDGYCETATLYLLCLKPDYRRMIYKMISFTELAYVDIYAKQK